MQEIKTSIEIAAPPSQVWALLTDVNNWSTWNPIVRASSGATSMGSKLDVTMCGKKEGEDGPRYRPVITELDAPRLFRWRAHMMAEFVFTNEKILELEEIPTGTRLTHTETFQGLMAAMMRKQMEQGVPPRLQSMNKALKERAEK